MIILYVYEIYILGDDENKEFYLILVIAANAYPVLYEFLQAWKTGPAEYC